MTRLASVGVERSLLGSGNRASKTGQHTLTAFVDAKMEGA